MGLELISIMIVSHSLVFLFGVGLGIYLVRRYGIVGSGDSKTIGFEGLASGEKRRIK